MSEPHTEIQTSQTTGGRSKIHWDGWCRGREGLKDEKDLKDERDVRKALRPIAQTHRSIHHSANSASTSRAAVTVASTSSVECAVETNKASYWLHGI